MNCETVLLTNHKVEWPLAGPIKIFYLMNSSSSSKFNFQRQLMVAAAGNTASSHTFCYQCTNKSQNLTAIKSHLQKLESCASDQAVNNQLLIEGVQVQSQATRGIFVG